MSSDSEHTPSVPNVTEAPPGLGLLEQRIATHGANLAEAQRRVSQHLAAMPVELLLVASAQELGQRTGTSNATVVRTLQALGFDGMADLKTQVANRSVARTARARIDRRLAAARDDLGGIADRVLAEARERIELLESSLAAADLAAAIRLVGAANRIFTYGVGVSDLAAEYLALKLARAGRQSRWLGSCGYRLADDLLAIGRADLIVIFTPKRLIQDTYAIAAAAVDVGASTILITADPGRTVSLGADVVLMAPDSMAGITSEPLASLLIGDIIVAAVMRASETDALGAIERLTNLRIHLGFDG